MPGFAEFLLAIKGCAGIARFDAAALRLFDQSVAGARRSFGVAIPVYFYYLLLVLDAGAAMTEIDYGRYLAAMSIGYVFLWISFPLLLLGISEFFDWRDRVPGAIAVYNWLTLLLVALHLPSLALDFAGWLPFLARFLDFAALGYMLVLNGFIFRRVLGIAVTPAALLVAGDFALSQLIIIPAFTHLGVAG